MSYEVLTCGMCGRTFSGYTAADRLNAHMDEHAERQANADYEYSTNDRRFLRSLGIGDGRAAE